MWSGVSNRRPRRPGELAAHADPVDLSAQMAGAVSMPHRVGSMPSPEGLRAWRCDRVAGPRLVGLALGADPPADPDAVFDMALGWLGAPVRAAYRAMATRGWSQPSSLASHVQPGRRSRRSTCSFREPRPTWLPPGETHPERRLLAHRPQTSPITEGDSTAGRAFDPSAESRAGARALGVSRCAALMARRGSGRDS